MKPIQEGKPLKSKHQSEPKIFGWLSSVSLLLLILATQLLPQGQNKGFKLIGIVLLVCAAAMIFIPLFLQSNIKKFKNQTETESSGAILQHNLYAILRHPQYFGYILMALGFACLSQHWFSIFLAGLITILFYLQMIREEQYCLENFGEEYFDYCKKVPRLNIIKGISRKIKRSK